MEEPIMTGLMRIDMAAIEGLLGASGRDGWLVEPLEQLEEYPESCRKPQPVKWREQQEADNYLARAENLATTIEPTLGERQVGVRLVQPEGLVCFRRTWQVSGVPKEWQELPLMKVLEKAGMLAPEMLQRFYKKNSSNWVVRALVENKDFIEI